MLLRGSWETAAPAFSPTHMTDNNDPIDEELTAEDLEALDAMRQDIGVLRQQPFAYTQGILAAADELLEDQAKFVRRVGEGHPIIDDSPLATRMGRLGSRAFELEVASAILRSPFAIAEYERLSKETFAGLFETDAPEEQPAEDTTEDTTEEQPAEDTTESPVG